MDLKKSLNERYQTISDLYISKALLFVNRKWRDQRGAVLMLESLIVFTTTLFLLFLVLAMFFFMFQRYNIKIVANEMAVRAAHTYPFMDSDINLLSGEIISPAPLSHPTIDNVRPYRYMWHPEHLEENAQTKSLNYVPERLRSIFAIELGEPQITVNVVDNGIARRRVEVTIEGSYIVPFGGAFDFFGMNSVITYSHTSYAESLDLINYLNHIDTMQNISVILQDIYLGGKTISAIERMIDRLYGLSI